MGDYAIMVGSAVMGVTVIGGMSYFLKRVYDSVFQQPLPNEVARPMRESKLVDQVTSVTEE